jgi:hypothetical protein
VNTQEQAYINGFVKRAAEYGIDENQAIELLKTSLAKGELHDLKASVPLNTIFGANPVGVLGSIVKDTITPNDVPSRFLNISVPSLLGAAGGGLLGSGISDMVAADDPKYKLLAALAGGSLGAMTGGYLGTKNFNNKIDETLKDDSIPWDQSSKVRFQYT